MEDLIMSGEVKVSCPVLTRNEANKLLDDVFGMDVVKWLEADVEFGRLDQTKFDEIMGLADLDEYYATVRAMIVFGQRGGRLGELDSPDWCLFNK
jgi:hypothetical protein